MHKWLIFLVLTTSADLAFAAESTAIFKCMKDGKVTYSHSVCPQDARQHKIEFDNGVTTEIDSDKREIKVDPLKALLNKQTISKEKLLSLLDAEIYRLKQENSYLEILRASEIQKLDRKRYWQTKAKDDPSYGLELKDINERFDELVNSNLDLIKLFSHHKMKINAEASPDEHMSQ